MTRSPLRLLLQQPVIMLILVRTGRSLVVTTPITRQTLRGVRVGHRQFLPRTTTTTTAATFSTRESTPIAPVALIRSSSVNSNGVRQSVWASSAHRSRHNDRGEWAGMGGAIERGLCMTAKPATADPEVNINPTARTSSTTLDQVFTVSLISCMFLCLFWADITGACEVSI